MTTLAMVAGASEGAFSTHYAQTMPLLILVFPPLSGFLPQPPLRSLVPGTFGLEDLEDFVLDEVAMQLSPFGEEQATACCGV